MVAMSLEKNGFSKYACYTMKVANNKGTDQTAQKHRLISICVVSVWHKTFFSGVAWLTKQTRLRILGFQYEPHLEKTCLWGF